MVQAGTSPASFLFGAIFQRAQFKKMYRYSGKAAFVLVVGCLWLGPATLAQQAKVSAAPSPGLSPEKAISWAEQGRCQASLAALKQAMKGQVAAGTRKHAGVLGVRCSLDVDDRDSALEFIHFLNKQFAQDPDVLFVVVHAYSDLSTRTAQDLGRTAPQSLAAHKLNAEALEMQGKWEPAQLEYEGMIKTDPGAHGIHFLLGRLLLSRPDAGPEAISRFSQAAKLNPNFAEAYLGWGLCLVTVKKYEDAIGPLRAAERITPGNPEVHHTLATALARSGHKEEAEKEFAIHRSLTSAEPASQE
jgi:tetratricopeptide (TPR) repeat protein